MGSREEGGLEGEVGGKRRVRREGWAERSWAGRRVGRRRTRKWRRKDCERDAGIFFQVVVLAWFTNWFDFLLSLQEV